MTPLLNIDLGELPDEPAQLYALAHLAHVACGGHAGDEETMRRAVASCARHGTRLGAHPSYPDREGFGRRSLRLTPEALRRSVRDQCAALGNVARAHGHLDVTSVKPHGALYHSAARDPQVAHALLQGVVEALGEAVVVVGPAAGALFDLAAARGLSYWREGFADRGMAEDGTLLPRGTPGALLEDPLAAAVQARRLLLAGGVETLCVHGDTPGAVDIARAVGAVLDGPSLRPLGDGAALFDLPEDVDRAALLTALREAPGVCDVVLGETEGAVYFDPLRPPPTLPRPPLLTGRTLPTSPRIIRVRYDGADLQEVADACGLTPDGLASLHAKGDYQARFIGFLPGFAYLGDLDERLVLPRRAAPRPRVPKGAVAIAERYTAVYPLMSPGGWHLLGTAVDFTAFHPTEGAALGPGDRVRFERVD